MLRPHIAARILSVALIASSTLVAASVGTAQTMENPEDRETLELRVGDIFEITPHHSLPNPEYVWILTKDKTFIEAGRAETFRKRLITPGRYELYAEISSGDRHVSRTFTLDWVARTPGESPSLAGSGSAATATLVQTNPGLDDAGRAFIPVGSQLIRLIPVDQNIRPIAADLDLARDSDGDGDPQNDVDTDLTFFQTDATPLYVWFTEPLVQSAMSVTALGPEGGLSQRIDVFDEAFAQEQGLIKNPVNVSIERIEGLNFSFSAALRGAQTDRPLLYHWEFGDGSQSLLANPTHEYGAEGAYDVTLRIRNLADGKDVATHEETIEVSLQSGVEPMPDDEEPVPDDVEPDDESFFGSPNLGSMLMLGGAFLGSILLGLALIFLFSKLRRRGGDMANAFEAMEQAIVKKDATATGTAPVLTIAAPAPSAAKQAPPAAIAEREKDNATTNPVLQKNPKIEESNAPSWLKSGLTTGGAAAPTTPKQPAPATPKPAPSVAQAPATSKPQAPKQPAPQGTPQATPAWLQQKPATPAPAPAQAAAPVVQKPAPVAPVQPAAAQTPSAPATPKPAPAPVQTPPVQPKPAVPKPAPAPAAPSAPVQPKPVTPPAPVPPQTIVQPTPAPIITQVPPMQTSPAPTPVPAVPTPPTPAPAPAQGGTMSPDEPIAIIKAESLGVNTQGATIENKPNPPTQNA